MKKILSVVLVLIVLGGGGWYMLQEQAYTAGIAAIPNAEKKSVLIAVEIEKGSSLTKIAQLLESKGVIVQKGFFERYVKQQKLENSLQAGKFTLNSGLTIPQVVDVLTGKVVPDQMKITIKEGMDIREIENLLIKEGLTTKKEFLQCIQACDFSAYTFLPSKKNAAYAYPWSYLEGYLFPDTYYISQADFQIESFLKQMLTAYEKKVTPLLTDTGKYSPHEIIILASIIEKESRPKDDQEIVAGILFKRLENNVQLATDATNRYIKEDALDDITYKELTSSNPYNTRKQKGLTPSPISNPGLASIKATLAPKESTYWYYLHDANGVIHFAATENEHNANKQLYLQ